LPDGILIATLVFFGGLWKGKSCKFCGHLLYFSPFYHEKSSNPAPEAGF
jgi:hypothetical protein